MQDLVRAHIERSIQAKQAILSSGVDSIVVAGDLIAGALRGGRKLLTCGNGGSAADAQHIASEFSIRYRANPPRPSLPAISLAADSSALTAAANDFGFPRMFARQIEGLGMEGDILLAITTSGNSPNVIEALKTARSRRMGTIVLTGGDGGLVFSQHRDVVDVAIRVPDQETARIQECHIMIGQILCALVEKILYGID